MKPRRLFVALGVAVAVLAAVSAPAQLMHLTVEGTFVEMTPPFVPVQHVLSDPIPFRAEISFNLNVEVVPRPEQHLTLFHTGASPFDPPDARNFMRWQFKDQELHVSLGSLFLFDDGRLIAAWSQRVPYLTFSLFLDPATPLDRLPLPPFSLVDRNGSVGEMEAGYTIARAYVKGSITHVTAQLLPVPEPATHASIAGVGLVLVILLRHKVPRRL